MTEEFLKFSASMGNDLISPIPYYQFPGLKEGDNGVYAYLDGLKPIK